MGVVSGAVTGSNQVVGRNGSAESAFGGYDEWVWDLPYRLWINQ
jgi:hypothetical protein